MSRIRSRMRSMLTRPSTRASGPPGHEWAPRPKAMCTLAFGRSRRNSAGTLEPPRVTIGRAVEHHHRRPGRDVDPADRRGAPGQTEVGLDRALDAQRLLDEVRDALPVGSQLVLELGILAEVLQADGEQPGRRLLTGREEERRRAHHGRHVGRGPVRIGAERQIGSARRPAARAGGPRCRSVNHVIEPSERIAAGPAPRPIVPGVRAQPEALAEPLVIGFGHPEHVGHGQHGEGLGVGA